MCRSLLVGLALTAGVAPVASAAERAILAFTEAVTIEQVSETERTLWGLAQEGDRTIARSGALYGDPALDQYLQGIVARLYPEFPSNLRARFIRSTQVNAFMQPNGSTYMFTGMLNFIDNEAQLAAIMAHEGAHFVDRHSYRGYKSGASKAVFGTLVSLGGVPLAGELIAVSSMMGYSRALEEDADAIGLERLARAGYDTREAKAPFAALVAYLKANDIKEPQFFASHPKLQQRVDYYGANEGAPPPEARVGAEDYLAITAPARMAALADGALRRDFKTALHLLEDPARLARFPPEAGYWLAVAYRQRNRDGDAARAEATLRATLERVPGFAPPHKALGEMLMRDPARAAEARQLFTRYLELDPAASDRGYVELHLKKLNAQEPKP